MITKVNLNPDNINPIKKGHEKKAMMHKNFHLAQYVKKILDE
jgi:hypothetical protein